MGIIPQTFYSTLLKYLKLFLYIFKKKAESHKKQNYKIWQDKFHPKSIYTPEFLMQKLEYIHKNPIRKELVNKPEHWKYSSAGMWIKGEENDVKPTLDGLFEN